jgi:hypothetical protein
MDNLAAKLREKIGEQRDKRRACERLCENGKS